MILFVLTNVFEKYQDLFSFYKKPKIINVYVTCIRHGNKRRYNIRQSLRFLWFEESKE
jgi:hypothetical protein